MSLGNVAIVNGKVTYNQLCEAPGATLDSPQFATLGKTDTSGLHRVTVLFQNSLSSCIQTLDQATSFRFQSIGATSQVSFCMDDISLLPSTLQPAGKLKKNCMHRLYQAALVYNYNALSMVLLNMCITVCCNVRILEDLLVREQHV